MLQLKGKLINHIRNVNNQDEAIIECPTVTQERIMAGDTIWVEKIVPSSEPLPQFLKRHPKIVAHFPRPRLQKEDAQEIINKLREEWNEIKLPEKFVINFPCSNEIERLVINDLIDAIAKLAERIKCQA